MYTVVSSIDTVSRYRPGSFLLGFIDIVDSYEMFIYMTKAELSSGSV